MRQNTTARSLIIALREYFSRTVVPDVIWSDGGPQFPSHEFATFLLEWGGGALHVISWISSIKWQSGGCRQIHEKTNQKIYKTIGT